MPKTLRVCPENPWHSLLRPSPAPIGAWSFEPPPLHLAGGTTFGGPSPNAEFTPKGVWVTRSKGGTQSKPAKTPVHPNPQKHQSTQTLNKSTSGPHRPPARTMDKKSKAHFQNLDSFHFATLPRSPKNKSFHLKFIGLTPTVPPPHRNSPDPGSHLDTLLGSRDVDSGEPHNPSNHPTRAPPNPSSSTRHCCFGVVGQCWAPRAVEGLLDSNAAWWGKTHRKGLGTSPNGEDVGKVTDPNSTVETSGGRWNTNSPFKSVGGNSTKPESHLCSWLPESPQTLSNACTQFQSPPKTQTHN